MQETRGPGERGSETFKFGLPHFKSSRPHMPLLLSWTSKTDIPASPRPAPPSLCHQSLKQTHIAQGAVILDRNAQGTVVECRASRRNKFPEPPSVRRLMMQITNLGSRLGLYTRTRNENNSVSSTMRNLERVLVLVGIASASSVVVNVEESSSSLPRLTMPVQVPSQPQ